MSTRSETLHIPLTEKGALLKAEFLIDSLEMTIDPESGLASDFDRAARSSWRFHQKFYTNLGKQKKEF